MWAVYSPIDEPVEKWGIATRIRVESGACRNGNIAKISGDEGYARIQDGMTGIIDDAGYVMPEPEYSDIRLGADSVALVKTDCGLWGACTLASYGPGCPHDIDCAYSGIWRDGPGR